MNFPGGVYTVGQSNVGRSDSAFNKLVVESGATVSTASSKDIYIYGTGCELTVDDGSVNCGGNVQVGSTESYDTNCLAKVCGTHPKMTITKSLNVKNGSCLRFELPATGYDANAATDANPVIDVGATAGNGVFIDETSRLELVGMEELMAYLTQASVRCNYVLIKANSGGINLPDGQTISHVMGQPQESRNVWLHNEQAIMSPEWSMHAAAGTYYYTFIWGMAGENLYYNDKDNIPVIDIK